jgi:steroid delta-isomerase-like uncharacterized protein
VTRDQIADFFARYRQAHDRHDTAALIEFYADDCVVESPMAGTLSGRDAVRKVSDAWIAAFPDVTFALASQVIDGESVVELETLTGTDTGGFMGLPPTNKSFELRLVRMYTLRDGRIVYERRIYDFTGMLVQIGVLKAKPA